MDNIFMSCRKGDLARVRYLVEELEINPNIRDIWDSTPLYYAALCGHHELVEYLLNNGATCTSETFDGERCLYGALTDQIRRTLLEAKVITSVSIQRHEFDEFCERLYKDVEYSDIELECKGVLFKVHKCILISQGIGSPSSNLLERLQNELKQTSPDSLELFLKYIYTGTMICTAKQGENIIRLALNCNYYSMNSAIVEAKMIAMNKLENRSKRSQLKPDCRLHVIPTSKDEQKLVFQKLLEQGLSGSVQSSSIPTFPDLSFIVDEFKFYCHKVFVCTRSPYFSTLISNDPFEEHPTQGGIKMVVLKDVKPSVLNCVLYFIYTNSAPVTEDNVNDVLFAADIYLLNGLKRFCGNFLCNMIEVENVVNLVGLARHFALNKLEESCAEFIANHVDLMVGNEEFRELVLSDASGVSKREETDSIDIIDEIRYHLSNKGQMDMEFATCLSEKFNLIDTMLQELGLDA